MRSFIVITMRNTAVFASLYTATAIMSKGDTVPAKPSAAFVISIGSTVPILNPPTVISETPPTLETFNRIYNELFLGKFVDLSRSDGLVKLVERQAVPQRAKNRALISANGPNPGHAQVAMTSETFRSIALGIPGAVESAHMRHPDFRCKGKVFATLGYPGKEWGMVKLSRGQQRSILGKAPEAFSSANGAWGRSGSTLVRLALARKPVVKEAMLMAFGNAAASKKRA